MITLGIIVLIIGLLIKIPVMTTIGGILLVIGLVLLVLGFLGKTVGGRAHWF